MINIRVNYGKDYQVNINFDPSNKEDQRKAIKACTDMYGVYAKDHTLSSKSWKAPILYINEKPSAFISMNGSVVPLEDWQEEKIEDFKVKNNKYPDFFSQANK